MPTITDRIILRAWRHAGEKGRIHYVVAKAGGGERHLYTDEGSALYTVLEGHLLALNYTAPGSSEPGEA